MHKKSTTPRKPSATKKRQSPAELRAQLARDIAAVLSNPETPTSLYNALSDEVLEPHSAVWEEELDTARGILKALEFRAGTKASMKGGAR